MGYTSDAPRNSNRDNSVGRAFVVIGSILDPFSRVSQKQSTNAIAFAIITKKWLSHLQKGM